MRFPWQDKDPVDGKPDDYPLDTWNEIWLAWIGLMLTFMVLMAVASYLID